MILAIAEKWKKAVACFLLAIIYVETVVPGYALGSNRSGRVPVGVTVAPAREWLSLVPPSVPAPAAPAPASADKVDGGPTQPEATSFTAVGSDKMVDLFTGDFSYSIPLLDVGGYPLTLGYNSGISMDQEASWTGLGWNLNPGSITRNMRGIPDDFNGEDQITKTMSVNENKTTGGSLGITTELFGMDLKTVAGKVVDSIRGGFTASASIYNNTYRGWGAEAGFGTSLSVGIQGAGSLTAGMGLSNSTSDGVTVSPSLDVQTTAIKNGDGGAFTGNVSIGSAYNTRSGMKALQFSGGVRMSTDQLKRPYTFSSMADSKISFAYPSSTPNISMAYTNSMFTGKLAIGFEANGIHYNIFGTGYQLKQTIEKGDQVRKLPAYGYLHYEDGTKRPEALLDFNRERELPVKEALKTIAIPSYTYDVFSISGEGTGGMFRAYRSDIGYMYDPYLRTKDKSFTGGLDLGVGAIYHLGANLDISSSNTTTMAWQTDNQLGQRVAFTSSEKKYEAAYFRNPGEMSINPKAFYETVGGDDVVTAQLTGDGTRNIGTSGSLYRYKDGVHAGLLPITTATARKTQRDKRTQLITYLNAKEASEAGLTRFIENYRENKYTFDNCNTKYAGDPEEKRGIYAEYETHGRASLGSCNQRGYTFWDLETLMAMTPGIKLPYDYFMMTSRYRLRAPVTGVYTVHCEFNDHFALSVNGKEINDFQKDWNGRDENHDEYYSINLEKGKMYDVAMWYMNTEADGYLSVKWQCGNVTVTDDDLFLPNPPDNFEVVPGKLNKEKRINSFRKPHHISEVNVLNADGKRYVYGLPVYNLKQEEVTFSADYSKANAVEGVVSYNSTNTQYRDDSTTNGNGNEHYFNREEIPAYAHSFLLTGIVSPDYVDISGDGITDDDAGNAVKFNYTRTAGVNNPYKWRTPYTKFATYNEGLKTDRRDDKGSYVYGEKELWYLNSVESKNMIAIFKLGDRDDLLPIDSAGNKIVGTKQAKRLDEINLYVKAEYLKDSVNAKPVKTVHFEYSYELCPGANAPESSSGKLTLKKLWFSYNGNESKTNKARNQQNAYVFHYNSNNPGYNSKSFDRWGNYKDARNNPGYADNSPISNVEMPYALQDSTMAAKNAAAWTLDSIVLPSGGRMKVTYESDDYAYVQHRRASKMTRIAGFAGARPQSVDELTDNLYELTGGRHDNLYVAFDAELPVTSNKEVFDNYLSELHDTVFFRLNVKMPSDTYGSGYEYVPCYAFLDRNDYGFFNNGKTIFVKLRPLKANGEEGGSYSPLAKAAVQFLRLNLPSKAFPDSEMADMDPIKAIQTIVELSTNLPSKLRRFDETARRSGWAMKVDLKRSHARLNDPLYKKYGGGLRVKRIEIYDHWNAMTGQKESKYGTEYNYTTTVKVDGVERQISSGVATYEPILGGEENSWHTPVMYKDQLAALAPTSVSYVEAPLGESFFPAASVGYSKVRTQSIYSKNVRSAKGYEETCFYTSYDFPTIVANSEIERPYSKAMYKPRLGSIMNIDSRYYLALSQGFKIELNDMHGKIRSQKFYSAGKTPQMIKSTTYFYKVDNESAQQKHLNNEVMAIDKSGQIASSFIGKDVELMTDMRRQVYESVAGNIVVDLDAIYIGIFPVPIPTSFPMPQSEENIFSSVAITKVIHRHGILDRVEAIENGSKVVTRNLLYDAETGDVLLTSVQNEFGDSTYQFSYPAHWAYDGMSGAYKNINTTLKNVYVKGGRIVSGLSEAEVSDYFASGDEVITYSRNRVAGDECSPILATFPSSGKVWALDANALNGGTPDIYFLTAEGTPFTGNDVTMKIIRSGRKNIQAQIGTVVMMKNPLVWNNGAYQLEINKDKQILSASMTEYKQNWHVEDKKSSYKECAYK
ncbi:PA14 domain-containing protein [Chitinophaga varians]|uniref:PA14 domain-containing protein n=1 Tax=Chitinophaga varians TaxID=2202339 RepID=UPI00165FD085|nr:PA14 domain-containing protein [Chitinophaga varians]MBC9913354.1 hypothetical protein [Chitinophaga varians]